jgi:hypothetical protein
MSSIAKSCSSLESRPGGFTVEALAGVLPQAWLHEAILESGRSSERVREAVRDMMQMATMRLIERYEYLLDAIARVVVPLRPGRRNPRGVKRKMSNYPLKPPPAHALSA